MGNKQSKKTSGKSYLDTVTLNSVLDRAAEGVEEGNSCMVQKEYREAFIAYRYSSSLFEMCIQHEGTPQNIKETLQQYNLTLRFKLQDLQALHSIEQDYKQRSSKSKHVPLSKKSLKLPPHIVKELNNTKKDPNDMTEEAQAYRRLLNNLEVCQPKVPMSDVIGQKHAIQLLQDKLVDKHIRPDFFKKSNTTGALLYGPPGNGKTTIATAIATVVAEASEGNMPFFIVSAADFTSKYVGQAEITLTAMFKLAQMNGPSIMFIDEVEQLFKSRTEGGNSSGTGVVQSFLTNMSTYRDVFFIAATNFPWYIDDALLRRMCPTYIRMPTKTDRLQLLKKLFAEDDHYLLKKDFETIAEKTEGFSFDDISKLKDEVDNTIMMITKEAKHFKQTPRMEDYEISWTPCMEYEEGATPKNYRSMVTKNNPEGLVHPSITMAVVEHALTLKAPTNSQEQIELQDLYFDKGKSGVEERLAEKEKSKSRKG